jgi:transcriptional antiterminator RfaH
VEAGKSSVAQIAPIASSDTDTTDLASRASERPAAAACALGERWFCVHTHPHSEAKAEAHLHKQGFEIYCPRYLKRRSHARRVDTISVPLFPRYLFVAIDLSTPTRAINSTVGVSHIVCNGDKPAAVPTGVVEELKRREDASGFININRGPRTGDKVRIVDGVFATFTGLFEGLDERERVAVLLNILGRNTRVFLNSNQIAAA